MKEWIKIILMFVIILVFFSGCVQTSVVESFTFNSGKGTCGTGKEIEIVGEDDKILFSGSVVTPDPCHELKASYSMKNSIIEIDITAMDKDVECIQCLGSVSFGGEIKIKEGHYIIRITYEENILAEKEIDVT